MDHESNKADRILDEAEPIASAPEKNDLGRPETLPDEDAEAGGAVMTDSDGTKDTDTTSEVVGTSVAPASIERTIACLAAVLPILERLEVKLRVVEKEGQAK